MIISRKNFLLFLLLVSPSWALKPAFSIRLWETLVTCNFFGFPDFFPDSIGLIGKLNQFGEKHKSATLQNFATVALLRVLNSGFWPLDDAALLNFATMRIYAIFRTENKGFVVSNCPMLLNLLLHSPKYCINFFKMDWNFRANQWYNQTQFYKMQLLCEIKENWKIFHDVIAENGPFFFEVLTFVRLMAVI